MDDMEDVIRKVCKRLGDLSLSGEEISRMSLNGAYRFLHLGLRFDYPDVGADTDGNVIFEWRTSDHQLSIEFVNDRHAKLTML